MIGEVYLMEIGALQMTTDSILGKRAELHLVFYHADTLT
jgi:hypothetical protein